MPRLIEYVSVGICSGYGDADYRVSSTVASLSPESMKELRLAMIYAIVCMEEMWRNEQMKKPENQPNQSTEQK